MSISELDLDAAHWYTNRMNRCHWVNPKNPLYIAYHDTEWCVPVHDDEKLFEFIVLESAQAGLSWETILNRREGYRKAFKNFDYKKVAEFTDNDVDKLVENQEIIRNKLKIKGAIQNAQAFIEIQKEFTSFSKYFWSFEPKNKDLDSKKNVAKIFANDMKRRGFTFFGATIAYAYMQAVGMISDHEPCCYKNIKNKMGTTSI